MDLIKVPLNPLNLTIQPDITIPKNVARLGEALAVVKDCHEKYLVARGAYQEALLSLNALLPDAELRRPIVSEPHDTGRAPSRSRRKVEKIAVPQYIMTLTRRKGRSRAHFDDNTKCQVLAWIQRMIVKGHSPRSIAYSIGLSDTTVGRWLHEAQEAQLNGPTEGDTDAPPAIPSTVKHVR